LNAVHKALPNRPEVSCRPHMRLQKPVYRFGSRGQITGTDKV
jgi:hypothetical protein